MEAALIVVGAVVRAVSFINRASQYHHQLIKYGLVLVVLAVQA